MAKVTYKGFEYEVPEELTGREVVEIEQLSGVPSQQFRGHFSVMAAMVLVTLRRHGATKVTYDELLDAPLEGPDSWQFVEDEEDEDVGKAEGADDGVDGSSAPTPEPTGAPL